MCCSLFWPGRPGGSGWKETICIHYGHLYKSFVAINRLHTELLFESTFSAVLNGPAWALMLTFECLRGTVEVATKYWTLFGDLSKARSVEIGIGFGKDAPWISTSDTYCESFRVLYKLRSKIQIIVIFFVYIFLYYPFLTNGQMIRNG